MTTRRYLPILLILAAATCANSALSAPLNDDEKFVVVNAGRIITAAGDEIRDGQIVLVDLKIRLVGTELKYPPNALIVDATDETVMPGMVLARTRWELPSYSRSGVYGDRSVTREMLVDQIDFEPLLENGFTSTCFVPLGNGMPGPSAVFRTGGNDAEREISAAFLPVTMASPSRDKMMLRGAIAKAKAEIAKVDKARKEWEEKQKKAKEEAAKKAPPPSPEKKDTAAEQKNETTAAPGEKKPEAFTPPKIDPTVLPLVEWIRDKKGPAMMFELRRASDLHHLDDALEVAPELPKERFYLSNSSYSSYSSADYHHIVADLGKRKAVVLLQPTLGTLPYTATQYNLPAELALAGCSVAVIPRSDSLDQFKSLRIQLAGLVRAGLPWDDAVKAVTLNAAKAIGLEKRLGSIEKGKDADLLFLNGNPISPETKITRVMTHGDIVWEAPQQP